MRNLLTIKELRSLRMAHGVAGPLLSNRAGMSATKLSKLELGYVEPSSDELSRLGGALCQLIAAREKVAEVAEEVGWPM